MINIKKFIIDSNALISNISILDKYAEQACVPYPVLGEIDRIKTENSERGYGARNAVRKLKELGNKIEYVIDPMNHNSQYNDDKILDIACVKGYGILTGDFLLQLKAKALGLDVIETDNKTFDKDYSGINELYLDTTKHEDNQTISDIYENKDDNTYGLVKNQYLVLWDLSKPTYDEYGKIKGYECIDRFKYNGEKLVKLKYKRLDNYFTSKIKPANIKQELMFDMLQDHSTTVKTAFGSFGVGKDFVMISHAVDMLMSNKIHKLVWVRNNVEVKDSNPIGFLPDGLKDKLLPFAMPLVDHLGGFDGLETFMRNGRIEIQHLGFIRGRDIKNSIIYCTEIENNTKEHIQLLIGRVGEGSQLWCNGDTRQIDNAKFIHNNGVNAMKRLAGQDLYGQVTLDKTERSDTAKLADLLD